MSKLACLTIPYNKYPLERALQGIANAGYEYVGIGHMHEGEVVPEENSEQAIEDIKRLLVKYNLKPLVLISHRQFDPKESVERAVRQLHIAKAFDIQIVSSLGVNGYREIPAVPLNYDEYKEADRAFIHKMKLIVAEAERLDITITLKPHTGNTATALDIRRLLEGIQSSHMKASYDPGNVSFYEGLRPDQDFPMIASDCASFVAKDHKGDKLNRDFPVPGEGDVNFPVLFKRLQEVGFSGPILVEKAGNSMDVEDIDQGILRARHNLERMMKESGLN